MQITTLNVKKICNTICDEIKLMGAIILHNIIGLLQRNLGSMCMEPNKNALAKTR